VERALILCRGEPLTFRDFKPPAGQRAEAEKALEIGLEDNQSLDAMVSKHIRRALIRANNRIGGKKGAAGLRQVNPSTLRKKMKKLGIPFGRKGKHPSE
jgi:formate hydrogenlyase transcriptional activator